MSIFHPFDRLPVEVRLQIWESACFATTTSERCLQYVTVKDRRVIPLPCHWRQSQVETSLDEKNKSAYLIDGGLWRACKESRKVIAQYSRYYDWLRIQEMAVQRNLYFSTFSADWAGGEDAVHPALIETCEGEEECCMLVYPARDIFCIKADNWKALQHDEPDKFELEMSFIRKRYKDELIPPLWSELSVNNIALEFDRSWLESIPDYLREVKEEYSSRGYFGYLLFKHAMDTLSINGLWIIDKEAKWFDRHYEQHDTVYRDSDTEYVEVEWSAVIHLQSDEILANSSDFMYWVDDWLQEYWHNYADLNAPEPKEIFRLLVRRGNEVQDPRIGRDSGAVTDVEGFGWVVFDIDGADGDLDEYLGQFEEWDSHGSGAAW
ncbi:hypothetical protein NW768_008593 [Fusarium equiseti]|uniref:2EXR domain-containing protein n=1 Tax=Fusarium equiseti TaxID=61235 RepID=A0ABQ8R4Z8_FUSEQ|nr:hypothetical protein NW768_008593 [Fusarium equiseti]